MITVAPWAVSAATVRAVAWPVRTLAADPALRARLGLAARRRVLGRSWSALTDELLGHYAAVIQADAPPARLAA